MTLATAAGFAVAAWPLNEASGTRADQVGSNDLSDNNTVGSGTGKVNGTCADFESDNSEYLRHVDSAELSAGDIDFMFRCWVKLESLSTTCILSKWSSGNFEYGLIYDSSTSRFTWFVNGSGTTGTVLANTFGAVSTGTWYLIHCWHDSVNNEIGISVNGVSDTVSHTPGVNDTNEPFCVGSFSDGGFWFWDGLIDDLVLLKDYLLDSTERSEDYNSGAGIAFADWAGGGGSSVSPVVRLGLYGGPVSREIPDTKTPSNLTATFTEGLLLSDVESVVATLVAQVTDGVELGDTFNNTLTALSSSTDGTVLSDSQSAVVAVNANTTDEVILSDAEAVVATLRSSIIDGINLGETWVGTMNLGSQITDGVTLSDLFDGSVVSGIVFAALSEGTSAGDSFVAAMAALATLSETTKVGDVYTNTLNGLATYSEGAKLSDTITGFLTSINTINDGVVASDAYSRVATLLVSSSDSVVVSDTYTRILTLLANLSDGTKLGNTLVTVATLVVTVANGVKLGDTFSASIQGQLDIQDIFGRDTSIFGSIMINESQNNG